MRIDKSGLRLRSSRLWNRLRTYLGLSMIRHRGSRRLSSLRPSAEILVSYTCSSRSDSSFPRCEIALSVMPVLWIHSFCSFPIRETCRNPASLVLVSPKCKPVRFVSLLKCFKLVNEYTDQSNEQQMCESLRSAREGCKTWQTHGATQGHVESREGDWSCPSKRQL